MPNSVLDRVAQYVDCHDLLAEEERVLVGVSGGADSMVCLSVLHRLGYEVAVFHANYGLRPGADADEALVRRWCDTHGLSLRVVSLDAEARARTHDESLQEAARRLRYDAMADTATKEGYNAVATGHHRDDQAETLLLNLVRGAGPEGLAGMPPSRPLKGSDKVRLVRPLLEVSRDEIETYATEHDVPWRADPTNDDPSYDRAALRNEILPRLNERFGEASRALARTATLMREYVEAILAPELEEKMARCFSACEGGGWIDRASLRDTPSVWRRRILLEALTRTLPDAPQSHAMATELESLLDAQVGTRVEVEGGTVWRERGGLRFLPCAVHPDRVSPVPVPWGEDVPVAPGTLRVDPLDAVPDPLDAGSPLTEYADLNRLEDPMALRSWKEGDRFQPLGMEGTKLVSDLLTEEKVPPHRRHAVCVLTTKQRIAWVVGHRLDHRVRVRPSTDRVARLSWRPTDHEKPSHDCNST